MPTGTEAPVSYALPRERALDRRELRLEPPTSERIERLVRLAMANYERQVSQAVCERLSPESVAPLVARLTAHLV